jgi:thioredoxin reductase (NADPH)
MEYFLYLVVIAVAVGWYMLGRSRLARASREIHEEHTAAGLTEPVSLHPVIDVAKCIGCGACIAACPETPSHQVLGLVNGIATLVAPTNCIGHGACRPVCPVDGITLVFGSATRGVELPRVSPWFETNVPGVFVAGELGGMGLIRNAVEQGRQAVAEIVSRRPRGKAPLDLVIVGAGPAGLSASLAATEAKLSFATVEQESLGGCVFQYPRGKIVMTQPATLPIVGKMNITSTKKEDLLEFWHGVERKVGLKIRYKERVESLTREGEVFRVKTTKDELRASTVLLAVGRRGTPRKLGVPGEELPKVVYRLIEPEQYVGQNVLVVGGGDSALEAAASCAEAGARTVILSYRGEAFQRAKPKNRERVKRAEQSGKLMVALSSQVKEIAPGHVTLHEGGERHEIENDVVIVNAGGVLPTEFLQKIGIEVVTKWGEA